MDPMHPVVSVSFAATTSSQSLLILGRLSSELDKKRPGTSRCSSCSSCCWMELLKLFLSSRFYIPSDELDSLMSFDSLHSDSDSRVVDEQQCDQCAKFESRD